MIWLSRRAVLASPRAVLFAMTASLRCGRTRNGDVVESLTILWNARPLQLRTSTSTEEPYQLQLPEAETSRLY